MAVLAGGFDIPQAIRVAYRIAQHGVLSPNTAWCPSGLPVPNLQNCGTRPRGRQVVARSGAANTAAMRISRQRCWPNSHRAAGCLRCFAMWR